MQDAGQSLGACARSQKHEKHAKKRDCFAFGLLSAEQVASMQLTSVWQKCAAPASSRGSRAVSGVLPAVLYSLGGKL